MVLVRGYVNEWICFFAWVFELFNVIIGILIMLGLRLKFRIIYMLLFIDLIFFPSMINFFWTISYLIKEAVLSIIIFHIKNKIEC